MVKRVGTTRSRTAVLKKIFSSPRYVIAALLAAAAYYCLFYYVMRYGTGIAFSSVPPYFVYALIASSAILVSLSVYELAGLFQVVDAGETGAISVCTASFGSVIAGCGCYAPIISSLLYALGLGTIQVSGFIALMGDNQMWLISLLIIINLAFIYYQSGRIARGSKPSKRG
jgi:hypothetical protein